MAKSNFNKRHIRGDKGVSLAEEMKGLDLERILIVPIDVAKRAHKALTANYFGEIHDPPFEFPNTRSGVEAFVSIVEQTARRREALKVVYAMEPTGPYHDGLRRALIERGGDVRLVNSYSVAAYRKAGLDWTKTDEKDLCAIGQVVVNGQTLHDRLSVDAYANLQLAARARRQDVKARSTLMNQIKDLCDRLAPGLTDSAAVGDFWSSPVPAILEKHPSAEAMALKGKGGLKAALRRKGLRPRDQTLEQILQIARDALPPDPATERFLGERLQELLERLRLADDRIRRHELRLAELLVRTPGVLLLSIPYVNVTTAAEFVGEIGPVENFSRGKSLVRFAGLNPGRIQSGAWEAPRAPITKRGNPRLRAAMTNLAKSVATGNPFYVERQARLLEKKPGQKKGKRAPKEAKVIIGAAIARHAFAMMRDGKLFAPERWSGPPLADDPLAKLENYLGARGAKALFAELAVQAAERLPDAPPTPGERPCKPPANEAFAHIGDMVANIRARLESAGAH